MVSPVDGPMSSPRRPSATARSIVARAGRRASLAAAALLALLAAGDDLCGAPIKPTSEFHFVRMFYRDGGGYRRGFGDRSWTVDYPEAELHFHRGVSRLTRVDIGERARMLRVTDDAIFDYPWLYAVEVGRWYLDEAEAARLREYLDRGGFLMDLGDAWEHADDPRYPEPMTNLAYRFAVNYVVYAMTR